jgi:biopolymer transport protein ExbD
MLAAMVDMMINILLFLLQLYGNSAITVQMSPDLVLPRSPSSDPLRYAASMIVSRKEVQVGDTVVATFPAEDRAPTDDELKRIGAALEDALTAEQARMQTAGSQDATEVVVQADRQLPWDQLGPLIATASDVGFANVRFVVATTRAEQE